MGESLEEDESKLPSNGTSSSKKSGLNRFNVSNRSVVQCFDDDSDEKEEEEIQRTTCDKFINYLFCRGDLARKKLTARPVSFLELFRFTTKFDVALLVIGIIGATISGFCQPLLALISGSVFDLLITLPANSTEFRDQSYTYVYIYFGMGCFVLLVNFTQFICFQHVCCRMIAQVRHHYMRSIIRQNAGWFDKNHCGTLTTQLNDNIERIREGVGDKLGLLVRGFAMFFAALVISFIYEWRLALFMCPLAPLTCMSMSLMARKMGDATSKELKDVGRAGAIAEESVLGVRTVQAFNGQEEMVERYRKELGKGSNHAMTKGFWGGFMGGIFYVILFCFMGAGFLFGGFLIRIGVMESSGDVMTVVLSMLIGAYFLGLISPHLMVLLNARVAAAVIYKTIDRKPRIDVYSDSGKIPMNVVGRIEFDSVHFRYPSRRDVKVLNGLSLTIEPGETVAFVGHSGCGKSTSVGLLTRLYEAESGRVMLDGIEVRELNIEWLRNTVGIVQQEPILFNDTVEENLRIGCPNISQADMIRVCKMANAHDFVMKLPKGYSTLIGDGGVQLSGGQKQRIAIARTLARNPKVLLLDEATSALDAQSESIVQQALDNAAEGRTTIVIAHRLSTVRNANKIVVFDKGIIQEMGTHTELIELGGRYAELVKAQQFQPEADEELADEDDVDQDTVVDGLMRSVSELSSGSEAFVRGVLGSDSFSRCSKSMAAGDQFMSTSDGDQFAHDVQAQMAEDGLITAGLFTIYSNAKGNYHIMAFAFITAIIRGFELPSISVAFGLVFAAFEYEDVWEMQHHLVIVFIVFTCIGFGVFLFHFASTLLFNRLSENLTIHLRAQTFGNILHQDAAYFDNPQHAPGRLITRLASDAPNVKAVVDGRMMYVTFNMTAWFVCTVVCFVSCWALGLLGLFMSLVLGGILITLARIVQRMNLRLIRFNLAGKFSIEIIENVRTIQLLTREDYFFKKYQTASKSQKKNEMHKGLYEGIQFAICQTFIFFAMGCSYALGIWIIYSGIYDANSTYRAILAVMLSCLAIMNCSTFFPEFVKARTAAGMLFNMMQRKPKTGDSMEGEKPKLRGNLLFEEVHFVYPQRPHQPVMRGLQFTAKKGQTVALVGPSGSGKSTVISLLERFYDVAGGTVRFDGTDIKKISLNHLRTQMALVGQEPRLFAGTIKENICFGLKEVSDSQIRDALELSNSLDFVSRLPQGLETEVGEKGTQLSGGQKQRIAIARALVRDPAVLLLDEATSALDSESERAVQAALDRAREGRTCITIAHRLSSIQNADVIVYVENGKVRESGSHSQLMMRKGRYYQLIKKQDLAT